MQEKHFVITRSQFLYLGCVAPLSPLIRLIPSLAVRLAGASAWLSTLLAAIPLLLLTAVCTALVRRCAAGEGLEQVFLNVLGPVLGRILLALYALWFVFYAGFTLRSGADRFIVAVYQRSGPGVFVVVMLLLCLAALLGSLRALGRTAELVHPLLLAAILVILLFSLPEVDLKNLPPPVPVQPLSLALGVLPTAEVLGLASYWGFLERYTDPSTRSAGRILPWMLLLLLIAVLLTFAMVGIFGVEMVTEMRYPFFYLVRELNILDFLQRIEALVIALWVFSDFIFVSALLLMAVSILRFLLGRPVPETPEKPLDMRRGRWLIPLCAAGALVTALTIAPTSLDLERWADLIVPAVNLSLTFGFFPLLLLIGRLRRRV